ncbi:helix-turn-helix domain-containing protein [Aquibium sp. A9E412]|uniref:IclR family transcriptional regulator domain-containing protein n=1 Tax=Aquibium sp. A9E412 TaxID=2976767 RepID=UPI0025B13AFA|nr:IclR family transcriptional regulator C-terminal domain-containing protein [Aquibium sp. A9E412]MDN2565179.1 helix-turn-helix domain-containing protein [Aquibium sp. A9E412]
MTDDPLSTHGAAGRERIGALVRGLAVLEVLAARPDGLTLTEVAAEAGLTRAGARRLLLTLVEAGYAVQTGRRFALSARLLSLARTWLGAAPLWTRAEPILREVSEALGESCSAAVRQGEDVVYVARAAGPRILSVALHVGTRLPAHCTSMGRVLLSDLDDAALAGFLATAAIAARTPKTVTDRAALARLIATVRGDGHALVDEELELGLRSIAVPVRDRAGRIVAAVNLSAQAGRTSLAALRETALPRLLEAARRIEDVLALA